jgi:hypothetical protein
LAVQAATARFDSALAKSDKLADDNDSARARRKRDTTLLEEVRLDAARAMLTVITAHLTVVSVAQLSALGAASRSAPFTSAAVDDEDSVEEKMAKRQKLLLEKRLPIPRFGWLDGAGKIHQVDHDRNMFLHQLSDMFWKLRASIKEQALLLPLAPENALERRSEVRRACLPEPDKYDEELEAMTDCQAVELGLNQLNEAASVFYIRHKYNKVVEENFVGDDFFGADRKLPLKDRMRASVKELQKLSAQAKAAVGNAGGPFPKKAPSRLNPRKGATPSKPSNPRREKSELPPGFRKSKPWDKPSFKDLPLFKCFEKGHLARDCPDK